MESREFTERMLIEVAKDQRKKSHAPYSKFTVGAACKGGSGVTYFGCNVENASYPVGICAERAAVASAISHGEDKITMIAISGGDAGADSNPDLRPCGMCLQFLSEFMEEESIILIEGGTDRYTEFKLVDLLPGAFRLPPANRD
ncbi:MAG TPA: cytidine deaminase [bacterium]|jgi:cytidine deaminase